MAAIALIKVLDYCSKSLERAREKLADLKQEYAENEANLTSLNEELKTAADRIKELEALKSPTFAEKEELETLKKENAERERQIALLKLEQELKQQEIAEKFVDVMDKDLNDVGEYFVSPDGTIRKQYSGTSGEETSTERDYIDQQLKLYQENAKAIAELDKQYADDLNNKSYKDLP